MKSYTVGERVIVVRSVYADVPVGQAGLIDCREMEGWGVKITKLFDTQSGSCRQRKVQTRIMFFQPNEIRRPKKDE